MEHRPTIVLTRPAASSARFARRLGPQLQGRAAVLIAPVLSIVAKGKQGDFSQFQTLIFTSQNGVEALADAGALNGRLAYCVGDRTAEAARAKGFAAVSAGGNANALVLRILEDCPPGPWVHFAGAHRLGDVARRLTRAGHPTDVVELYRQEPHPLSEEAKAALRGAGGILPVFSPRSAALLAEALPSDAREPAIVAISPAAAEAWDGPARARAIADRPDADSMIQAILSLLDADSGC